MRFSRRAVATLATAIIAALGVVAAPAQAAPTTSALCGSQECWHPRPA